MGSAVKRLRLLEEKESHAQPGGLIKFIRFFWPIVEPARPLIEGWPLEAICEHLEAVTNGEIKRLLINIPPGFMKSMTSNVFFPAWEWGPLKLPSHRFIAASYSQNLTLRDNVRFRNIIMSNEYREMYGDVFAPSKDQFNLIKVANDKTGWKLATSVGGIGTGERGDRFVIDDGNSVAEAESEAVRESTNQWFSEVVPTRLNDAKTGAIINIQQRTHEEDISGIIIARELGYEHLMIPMEWDGRRYTTVIGWTDPREEDGELAWPERFDAEDVADLKRILGPYAASGQLQQSPSPRGGGIIKREWWGLYEPKINAEGKAETHDLIYRVAALDPAYTEKEENDPSGFTIWGVYKDKNGNPRIVLLHAWRKRLELHGPHIPREPGETTKQYTERCRPQWGLVETVSFDCKRFKANTLLIESKASGLSVNQEIRRLHMGKGDAFVTQLVDPKKLDKVARLYAVQHIFAEGLVEAPDRAWADMVIDEVSSFPKGRYDDLTDTVSMALKHLREIGYAIRREERHLQDEMDAMHYKQDEPLYDV